MATHIQILAGNINPDQILHSGSGVGEDGEATEYRCSRFVDDVDPTNNVTDVFVYLETEPQSGNLNVDLQEGQFITELRATAGGAVVATKTVDLGTSNSALSVYSTLYGNADTGELPPQWTGAFFDLNPGGRRAFTNGWHRVARFDATDEGFDDIKHISCRYQFTG